MSLAVALMGAEFLCLVIRVDSDLKKYLNNSGLIIFLLSFHSSAEKIVFHNQRETHTRKKMSHHILPPSGKTK